MEVDAEGEAMTVGGFYNWKGQPERLVYLGMSRNGLWYQFAKVNEPDRVWCEVRGVDLAMFEESKVPA
jgi:hypothetical protein